ncbi:MAG: hypothetical protein PUD34_04600 [bacterium]|nr:hypothetical protein [bacterium]
MQKLNDLFQELGISKVRLAKYLGVSRQMVYNYLELDDINKWPKEKKIMLYKLLDISDGTEIENIKITTDYLMSVESRLNKGTKGHDESDSFIDMKGLNSDSQKLLSNITSLLKDRLSEDNSKKENFYTLTYLYHTLLMMDSIPEIRYIFGYMSKTGGYTDPEEYKLQEDKQFILEGILYTALGLYNNGGSSRSKLQLAHRRWLAEIEAKKEEKISRTQELSAVKIQALKELNYSKMDNSNGNEVIEKILEILARKN